MKHKSYNIAKALWMAFVTLLFPFLACKKQDDFLNVKSIDSDVIPSTLKELQGILDYSAQMNSNYIIAGLIGSDNYYVQDSNSRFTMFERNSYVWQKDIYQTSLNDAGYGTSYVNIRNANIALEGLQKIKPSTDEQVAFNTCKGHALFVRAFMFYNLVNTFAKPYQKETSGSDLGIPLRTISDVNIIVKRSTVQETYDQIINDLQEAISLLPSQALVVMRPSKQSAYALLAKTYLLTANYENAKKCCDSILQYNNRLLDFSDGTVTLSKTYRFPDYKGGNPEILYYAEGLNSAVVISSTSSLSYIDTVLYNQYDPNDLRKTFFYSSISPSKAKLIGTYTGLNYTFAGLAMNEVYFIRAECRIRLNDISHGLDDMNLVLRNRYKPNTYTPFSTTDANLALTKVLEERRKEFPFTEQIRWEDLRRLNTDSRFAKTITRLYQGVTYTLPPNDSRYVYPFNKKIIDQEGLQQNIR